MCGVEEEHGTVSQFTGNDTMKQIDLEKLLVLVENGTIGKIMEVESSRGDTVEIVVE